MAWRDFFRKFRKDDTIDLSDLQRRGIIKPRKSRERDTVDLTNNSSDSGSSSPLGFLGSLAGASSNSDSDSDLSSETETSPYSGYAESSAKQKLKGILRDLKAKIDSVYDRTYKLSERIDLLERKIERLERRAGVSE